MNESGKMATKPKSDTGFTIIEMMIVVAIISVLAAIALPNYIAYRDKSCCTSVEQDAGMVLAALSCYFAEPDNTTCISLESLGNDPNCGFSVNNIASLTQQGSGNRACWTIEVTDMSNRCPRSTVFSTYMGTSTTPGWR